MSNYIKIIHTLKGKAGMSEGDYRALLQRCGRVNSSRDLDDESARMVCAVLRGMVNGESRERDHAGEKRTPGEKMIWQLWYQLQPYLPECDRCTVYFLGIIDKVTGREYIPNLVSGRKVQLRYLGPRWTYKVIEALKQRLKYEEERSSERITA